MSDVDEKAPEEVPDGMVKRTRKVRKKRKSQQSNSEGKAHADTLFAKAKDLFVGMHDEEDDHGHVDVAEQVRRLNQKKEDDRPLDDVWGTKKRSSSWLWIVLVGLIISVMAIVLAVTMWTSDKSRDSSAGDALVSPVGRLNPVDLSKGSLGWFNENSIQVLNEVERIIHFANRAETPEELSQNVRASPYRAFNPLRLETWGSDHLTNPTSKFSWTPKVVKSSDGGERGYVKVTGTRVDGNPFEAYFVESENRVLLDWDATVGWSEMAVAEIAEKKPRKEVLLRCRVSKKTTFDQSFGTVEYSGYVISGDVSDEFFLAYVPLDTDGGKAMDRELRLLLNYGSFVSNQPPYENQKVTLRVSYSSERGKNGLFEIVEFLHEGWVSP